MAQIRLTRVLARPSRRLQDHRAIGGLGRAHDRVNLLHVVDVERGHAVVVFGRVIQQLPQGDEGHCVLLDMK
ncbi:hypothetical protein HDG35_006798 [Paraburkholderia sp. JPY681]|nr:hypothetical protein [Paraburkholderia atlantica]